MQVINGHDNKKKKKHISVGYIILLALMIIFIIRSVKIVNSYRERGGLAYVQLLNFSMPIVETQIYDSTTYRENKVSIKNVVIEALGLNNISTYGIVGNEVGFFQSILKASSSNSNKSTPFNPFQPYVVKEDSIARVTDAEVAELSKVSVAYDPSLKKELDNSQVEVLIYHTHTHEGYIDVGTDSADENFSVVGVGNVIADELENGYGISVIHDKTIHDMSPYTQAYYRSQTTVENYLKKFPNLKLIIDIHRNGGPSKEAVTANLNGQNLARFMFVTSKNSPNYPEMMNTVNDMISTCKELFPGLLANGNNGEGLYEYNSGSNTFNQKLSPACVLMEFGADVNYAQEAKLSGKYAARLIAEHLNR